MSLPPPSEKLNTLMQCLPDAPFKGHLAEEIKSYGQACREAALEENKQDKARLDWLDQNLFNRENLDMFGKVCKDYNMWVMFSPVGVQGPARTIIDAAMNKETK